MAYELSLRREAIEARWIGEGDWWQTEWKAVLREFRPDFIVNLTIVPRNADKVLIKRYRKSLAQLAETSNAQGVPLLQISSVLVFDGDKSAPYLEGDAEAPYDVTGEICLSLEEAVATNATRFIILRTASIFSSRGDNLLTQIIRFAEQRKTLVFDPSLAGCPTCANDIARVIIAIVMQLHCGADPWGIYHYTSSDITSGYQFAEAVLAIASQFDRELHLEQVKLEERAVEQPEQLQIDPVVVSCQKLLNTFGVKQRPWRSQLTTTVRNYFESDADDGGLST